MVWAYTLVSFGVASAIKVGAYRLLDTHSARRPGILFELKAKSHHKRGMAPALLLAHYV